MTSPKEHWKHLRTSNVVDSPFAPLRLRTNAAKRFKNSPTRPQSSGKCSASESTPHRLDAPERLADVYDGRRFADGKLITRTVGKGAA